MKSMCVSGGGGRQLGNHATRYQQFLTVFNYYKNYITAGRTNVIEELLNLRHFSKKSYTLT